MVGRWLVGLVCIPLIVAGCGGIEGDTEGVSQSTESARVVGPVAATVPVTDSGSLTSVLASLPPPRDYRLAQSRISELLDGFLAAWNDGIATGTAFTHQHSYPGYSAGEEECAQALDGSVESITSHHWNAGQSPAWGGLRILQGRHAGEVVSGYASLRTWTFRFVPRDGGVILNTTSMVEFAIVSTDSAAYLLVPCELLGPFDNGIWGVDSWLEPVGPALADVQGMPVPNADGQLDAHWGYTPASERPTSEDTQCVEGHEALAISGMDPARVYNWSTTAELLGCVDDLALFAWFDPVDAMSGRILLRLINGEWTNVAAAEGMRDVCGDFVPPSMLADLNCSQDVPDPPLEECPSKETYLSSIARYGPAQQNDNERTALLSGGFDEPLCPPGFGVAFLKFVRDSLLVDQPIHGWLRLDRDADGAWKNASMALNVEDVCDSGLASYDEEVYRYMGCR